jgi:hypothetical protein
LPETPAPYRVPLIMTSSDAVLAPNARGENVTAMEHDPPMATGAVQLLVSEKSLGFEPPNVTFCTTMDAVAPGSFETASNSEALCEPITVSGNVKFCGETPGIGYGAIPLPERATVVVGALLLMMTDPLNVPVDVGAKVSCTTHEAPEGSVATQSFVWVKLGSPETAILVKTSVAKPEFMIEKLALLVCPVTIEPRFWGVAGVSVTAGALGIGAAPLTAIAHEAMFTL